MTAMPKTATKPAKQPKPAEKVRMAPHSEEAEQAFLGSVLIGPLALPELANQLQPEEFFILRHNWIWAAMLAIFQRGETLDYLLLAEELRTKDQLEDIGGPAYLTYLGGNTPTSTNAEAYARIVKRTAMRRKMLNLATELANLAVEESIDASEAINQAALKISELQAELQDKKALEGPADEHEALEGKIRAAQEGQPWPGLIPFGDKHLASKLQGGGCLPGYAIITGETGLGKTSYVLNLIRQDIEAGLTCGLFSLEMSAEQNLLRMRSAMSGIPESRLITGKFGSAINNKDEQLKYDLAMVTVDNWIEDHKLLMSDHPSMSVLDIIAATQAAVTRYQLKRAYIDFTGLLKPAGLSQEKRSYQELEAAAQMMHTFGLEHGVSMVAVVQQSSATNQEGNRGLAGARGQGFSSVLTLYLKEGSGSLGNQKDVQVVIDKQRFGPAGDIAEYWYWADRLLYQARAKRVNLDDVG